MNREKLEKAYSWLTQPGIKYVKACIDPGTQEAIDAAVEVMAELLEKTDEE